MECIGIIYRMNKAKYYIKLIHKLFKYYYCKNKYDSLTIFSTK